MNRLLVLFIFLSGHISYAQTNASELRRELAKSTSDTASVFIMRDLTEYYYNYNLDSAFYFANKTLETAEEIQFKEGVAWGTLRLGFAHVLRGDIPNAITSLERSLQIADSLGNNNISSRALANLGRCMLEVGRNNQAITFFLRSIENRNQISSEDEMAALVKTTIAETYLSLKQPGQAEMYLEEAISLNWEDKVPAGRIINTLADLNIEKGNYDEAELLLEEAWQLVKNSDDLLLKLNNRYYKAKLNMKRGDVLVALEYSNEALIYSNEIGSLPELVKIYNQLALIENEIGNYKSAVKYFMLSNSIRDSIQSTQSKNSAALFQLREQQKRELILQNEKEILQISQRNQQNVIYGSITIFILVTGGLTFFVINRQRVNKNLNRINREIQNLNKDLTQREKELSAANDELIQQKEEITSQLNIIEERNEELQAAKEIIEGQNKRIAEDNSNLEEAVKERTNELLTYNQQLEQYAFITSHNLRSPVAQILGLGSLLEIIKNNPKEREDVVNRLVESTKELDRTIFDLNRILEIRQINSDTFQKVSLQEQFSRVLASLDDEIKTTNAKIVADFENFSEINGLAAYVYSIFHNLLTNAIKFRSSERSLLITIETTVSKDGARLRFSDNGIGFNAMHDQEEAFALYKRLHDNIKGRGVGLFLVKTQVEALGGSISVFSVPDEGTTFEISFPVF